MNGSLERCAIAFLAIAALCAAGCSGPRLLSRPQGLEDVEPLVAADDTRVAVTLDAVVVPNGPGSWASDAAWDEYRLRIRRLGEGDVRVERVTVIDALGHPVASSADRAGLIDGSREVDKRYEASGQLARTAGGGSWEKTIGGTAATAAGGAAIGLASVGGTAFVSAGAVAGAAAGIAGVGFLVGAGITKLVNNTRVGNQLAARHTPLPITVGPADTGVIAFFPTVPLPSAIEVSYTQAGSERRLRIPANEALANAHLPRVAQIVYRPEPDFPAKFSSSRADHGFVKALLVLDGQGDVRDVKILYATLPELIPEAKSTFRRYKYTPGWNGRSIQETMRFERGLRW